MKRKTSALRKPVKTANVPATCGMLYEMESRLNHRMDTGFMKLESTIHGIKSELHRVALIVEEQAAQNRYVLDGYAQIYDLIKQRNKDL